MNVMTRSPGIAPDPTSLAGMAWVPAGGYRMGSDHHYPEEAPAHPVEVAGFWMDVAPVTNAQFRRFVETTGYVTYCEIAPTAADYPNADPAMLFAASSVFAPPSRRVDLRDHYQWWQYIPGANWRLPQGRDASIEAQDDHPVVHVAYADIEAYARWAGKALPTEAEFEWAARGGADGEYAWGDELTPDGRHMANIWQGEFPWQNLAEDGYAGTSPVGAYPANAYGLHDLIGNVWEWTCDWYRERHPAAATKACCIPNNPRGANQDESYDPEQPLRIPRKVIKGGSHLCAPNYCRRYRPSARMAQPVDTSTSHLGFRCVMRGPGPKG